MEPDELNGLAPNDDPRLDQSDAAPPPDETVHDAVRAALEQARAPAEDGEEGRPQRSRDEQGRFTAEQREEAQRQGKTPEQVQAETQAAAQPLALGEEPLAIKAPVGWNAAAKAQFDRLPAEVKEAVARREVEVNNGLKILQDYKGLDEFTPMIKQSGITYHEFAKRAVEWERALLTRPADTVTHALNLGAKNAGTSPAQFAASVFMRAAQQAGITTPQQIFALLQGNRPQTPAAPQPQPQPQGIHPDQVRQLVNQELASRDVSNTVDQFLKDPANVHAKAVVDDMAALIQTGRAPDLNTAYDMACWARPDIRAQFINQLRTPAPASNASRQQAQVQAARARAKAVSGAPSANQATPQSRSSANASVMDDVRESVEALRGAA